MLYTPTMSDPKMSDPKEEEPNPYYINALCAARWNRVTSKEYEYNRKHPSNESSRASLGLFTVDVCGEPITVPYFRYKGRDYYSLDPVAEGDGFERKEGTPFWTRERSAMIPHICAAIDREEAQNETKKLLSDMLLALKHIVAANDKKELAAEVSSIVSSLPAPLSAAAPAAK